MILLYRLIRVRRCINLDERWRYLVVALSRHIIAVSRNLRPENSNADALSGNSHYKPRALLKFLHIS